MDDLIRLTATEAVARLKRRDISPLDLIDAAEKRIGSVEPAVKIISPSRQNDRGGRLLRWTI